MPDEPNVEASKVPHYEPKPSRCMMAAKAAEHARLMAMTARERAELALELGRRYGALADAQRQAQP